MTLTTTDWMWTSRIDEVNLTVGLDRSRRYHSPDSDITSLELLRPKVPARASAEWMADRERRPGGLYAGRLD